MGKKSGSEHFSITLKMESETPLKGEIEIDNFICLENKMVVRKHNIYQVRRL